MDNTTKKNTPTTAIVSQITNESDRPIYFNKITYSKKRKTMITDTVELIALVKAGQTIMLKSNNTFLDNKKIRQCISHSKTNGDGAILTVEKFLPKFVAYGRPFILTIQKDFELDMIVDSEPAKKQQMTVLNNTAQSKVTVFGKIIASGDTSAFDIDATTTEIPYIVNGTECKYFVSGKTPIKHLSVISYPSETGEEKYHAFEYEPIRLPDFN